MPLPRELSSSSGQKHHVSDRSSILDFELRMPKMETMPGQLAPDRRQTARIPAGAKLLLRAVGMSDYVLCDVLNITTSGIELLLARPLEPGTVVTILVRPEGTPQKYYRVVGSVMRRESRYPRWWHVVRASSKRPWSSMFIYDVMYQALTGSRVWPAEDWLYVGKAAAPRQRLENNYSALMADLERAASQLDATEASDSGPWDGDPVVQRALAWFAPFDELDSVMRRLIAREQHVTRKAAGTTLVERGSLEDISVYLVEGIIEVEAFDEKRFRIAAGTHDSHFPISVLRPHAYTVRAVTDVVVILISQDIVRNVARITGSCKSHLGIEVWEEEQLPAELAGD